MAHAILKKFKGLGKKFILQIGTFRLWTVQSRQAALKMESTPSLKVRCPQEVVY